MPENLLRLSLPHIDEEAIAAVVEVLRSGRLVHGEQGDAFEREIEQWLGAKHAVLVSSGTAALHLALLALDVGAGDAVLVPDFTFPATANVVMMTGARPVLVDVDAQSYCVTAEAVSEAVHSWRGPERLRVLMPVHEFGRPVDMGALRAVAQAHSLRIIEDAACAIGARDAGRLAGTLGDIGCFSLHPRKTLTTGEGGILATDDDALAARLRRLRSHGVERCAQGIAFREPGLNYRLTDFQAALGRAQLRHLQGWIAARRALAKRYRDALHPLEQRRRLTLPVDVAGHSWQTYMVVLGEGIDRAAVIRDLADRGIEAGPGAHCLSGLEPFLSVALPPKSNAMRLHVQGLALPFCEQYGQPEVDRVASALHAALPEPA